MPRRSTGTVRKQSAGWPKLQRKRARLRPRRRLSEERPFQAEVTKLLHLMVHSVYSEREVFLRELISNAADACDRLRYEAISKPELLAGDATLAITIEADKSAKTLTVTDTGVGMSREDLIDNLGTIAKSGTQAFMANASDGKDAINLIGQFGVGFYSAFIVAKKVEVFSLRAGTTDAHVWSSDGGGGFTIAPAPGRRRAGNPHRPASQGRCAGVCRAFAPREHRQDLFGPYRPPDQARHRQGHIAPDQCGERHLGPAEGRNQRRAVQGVFRPRGRYLRRSGA